MTSVEAANRPNEVPQTLSITTAAVAVCRGTMDIAPADPVEGSTCCHAWRGNPKRSAPSSGVLAKFRF